VQRETLDHLHEGVAVFAETGRLKLSNPTFRKQWQLDAEFSASEPHLRELFTRTRALFTTDAAHWPEYLEQLVARFQQRRHLSLRFERADSTVVDCSVVPLPDGATLLSFIDVTDSTVVERSLRDRAEALETADRMKSESFFRWRINHPRRSAKRWRPGSTNTGTDPKVPIQFPMR
jgi:hypothetical protein